MKLLSIIVLFIFTSKTVNAQKLKSFGSSIEKKLGPVTKRVPYTDVVSF